MMKVRRISIFFIFFLLFILNLVASSAAEGKSKNKLIVLPLQPEKSQEYDGTGLGIHFLLGNVVAVHTGLKEFWFGWRLTKIFKGKNHLQAYCKGNEQLPDIATLGREQKIRYWLDGTYKKKENIIFVTLNLFDVQYPEKNNTIQILLDTGDHLIKFRKLFLTWLETCGLPMSKEQAAKVVWPEKITIDGLDFLGRALDTTYQDYFSPRLAKNYMEGLEWFDKALALCPESYLIHDLKGWALYKNKAYDEALISFQTAVELNENGLGALSGMMWCYIYLNNQEKAIEFSLAKADTRNESHEKASALVVKKINAFN